jgi:hypothetical protein
MPTTATSDRTPADRCLQPKPVWRRWTGIEPASWGSPMTTALKAAEPTRCSYTSVDNGNADAATRVSLRGERVDSLLHRRLLGRLRRPARGDRPDLEVVRLVGDEVVTATDLDRVNIAFFSAEAFPNRCTAFFTTLRNLPNLRWFQTFSSGTDRPIFDKMPAASLSRRAPVPRHRRSLTP